MTNPVLRQAYMIDADEKHASDNFQQTVALEIALGISLPDSVDNWPLGLQRQWNNAAKAGAFDHASTLGELALAFLNYRRERFALAFA